MIRAATAGLLLLSASIALAADPTQSVYQISGEIDGPIIGATALGSIVPQALNSSLIHPTCPCDSGSVNAFDRMAIGDSSQLAGTMSDFSEAIALLVPPLLDMSLLGANRALFEDMVVYAEVLSVSGALVTTAKYTVQRPIPLAYSGNPAFVKDPNSYISFYSGHTTLAFAALSAGAMTADLRYRSGVLPWFVVTALGGSIAYERVAAGRHFPTDVIAGAVTGSLEGILIPLFHSRNSAETLLPAASQNAVALVWKKAFE